MKTFLKAARLLHIAGMTFVATYLFFEAHDLALLVALLATLLSIAVYGDLE